MFSKLLRALTQKDDSVTTQPFDSLRKVAAAQVKVISDHQKQAPLSFCTVSAGEVKDLASLQGF
ncbi:hypothetical protein [Hahella sp. NBU794]|uniref:hypothetical protein n=1 Tax=Hahella sp. NBU794 TaxID=3422590 RepID=UPI003D6E46A6